jgi:hypothetical protein
MICLRIYNTTAVINPRDAKTTDRQNAAFGRNQKEVTTKDAKHTKMKTTKNSRHAGTRRSGNHVSLRAAENVNLDNSKEDRG